MGLGRFSNPSAGDLSAGLVPPTKVRQSDVNTIRSNYGIASSFSPKGQSDQSLYSHSVQFVLDWWKKTNAPPAATPAAPSATPPAAAPGGGASGGGGVVAKPPAATAPAAAAPITMPYTSPGLTSNTLPTKPVVMPYTSPGLTSNTTKSAAKPVIKPIPPALPTPSPIGFGRYAGKSILL